MRRSQAEGSGLVLILAFAGIGIGIIGWSLPANIKTLQSGTTTCTLTALTYKTTCAITFPNAFASTPKIDATAIEFATSTINWGSGTTTPLVAVTFQSPDNTPLATCCTWNNMPAANTELYGATNSRIIINPGPTNQIQFSVGITTVSTGASPTLEVDVNSAAGCGGTWTSLVTVSIAIAGNTVISAAISSGALLAGNNCFRISGTNGGGVGDNPQFGILLASFTTVSQSFIIDKTSITTTTLNYFIAVSPVLVNTKTLTLNWHVYICRDGTSNCS